MVDIPTDIVRNIRNQIASVGRLGYNRWREFRADRTYKRRDSPTPAGDATDNHIVLVVVDALRTDVVQDTDFLATLDGVNAVAAAPWTYPSVTSIVTGQYPHEHGAMRQHDNMAGTDDDVSLPPKLSDEKITVPELLGQVGYETFGAFGFAVPFLALEGRFATHKLFHEGSASTVLDSYRQWRSNLGADRSFAYLHLFDLHGPFENTPPQQYWEKHDVDRTIPDIELWRFTDQWEGTEVERYIEHRKRLYRAAVDYVDDQLQSFANDYPETTLLVTSDHGEAFWEHAAFDAAHFEDPRPAYSVGHGGTPYEEIARVPILGDFEYDDNQLASLIDVAPTILGGIDLEPPDEMSGRPLKKSDSDSRTVFIESTGFGYEKKAAYAEDWKLLVSHGDEEVIGFDLPEETPTDLPEELSTKLLEDLPPWPDGDRSRAVGSEVERRLEHLGYK